MNDTQTSPRTLTGLTVIGVIVGIAGLVIVILGIGFSGRGFWGGVIVGGGLGLAMVGTYFWGFSSGMRRTGVRGLWRPSEDARR